MFGVVAARYGGVFATLRLRGKRAISGQLEFAADGGVGFVVTLPNAIGGELDLDAPVGDALDRVLDGIAFAARFRLRVALTGIGAGVGIAQRFEVCHFCGVTGCLLSRNPLNTN